MNINKSSLIEIVGHPATLVHGDTLVLDRWQWLKSKLPITRNREKLIDIGCGTGAFSIGAALRGYEALGLSWDERNQDVANERAKICRADLAKFEVLDVRALDSRDDLFGQFDVVICCENIEHIIDDRKLMRDMASCLKPGGRLLLTAPYLLYRAITPGDNGPFKKIESGWHVRRGYSKAMLRELCEEAGLTVEEISSCSGFLSQKITACLRIGNRLNPLLSWALTFPFRLIPPFFDKPITDFLNWPYFSICLEAYKPRYR